MALAAQLDKTTYNVGDTMTLTVTTDPGEREPTNPITVHVDAGPLGTVDLTGTLVEPQIALSVTDPDRTWTAQSDDGTTAVYTATA